MMMMMVMMEMMMNEQVLSAPRGASVRDAVTAPIPKGGFNALVTTAP